MLLKRLRLGAAWENQSVLGVEGSFPSSSCAVAAIQQAGAGDSHTHHAIKEIESYILFSRRLAARKTGFFSLHQK